MTMKPTGARRVYIAGPYTKPDPCVNVRNAIAVADKVWKDGHLPFVPHLSHLWHLLSPHDYEEWLEYDLAWLNKCDCLLRMPGESAGADREVAEAQRLGLPVYFGYAEFRTALYHDEVAANGGFLFSRCTGHDGPGPACCERAGQYNGYGSDGPILFDCPHGCSCHD